MCLLILANYSYGILDGIYDDLKHDKISWVYFPVFFIIVDAFILLIAVIRVGIILSHYEMVTVNFKFMALHCMFLFLWGLATLLAYLPYIIDMEGDTLWYWTFYSLVDFGVSCFMAFIFW